MPRIILSQHAADAVDLLREVGDVFARSMAGKPSTLSLETIEKIQKFLAKIEESQKEQDELEPLRQQAIDEWQKDGEIEIDPDAVVSVSDDDGAYVQAWVWIDVEIEERWGGGI